MSVLSINNVTYQYEGTKKLFSKIFRQILSREKYMF